MLPAQCQKTRLVAHMVAIDLQGNKAGRQAHDYSPKRFLGGAEAYAESD
jgi:hypothetical protein